VLPTLVGIILVGMLCVEKLKGLLSEEGTFQSSLHSFASGVIFAAAVFLLLPEGLYLITVGKTEAGGAGAWGTAILAGWTFCVLIKHFCQLVMGESTTSVVPTTNGETDQEPQKVKGTSWLVSFPILFGDMFHNFSDGLVLGVAFKTCGASFGWKIAGVTVLHEIPQELSDFAVLITKGRMAWPMALTLNFVSGLSTVVGAIITYSIDVSSGVEGALLAAGAGVYLYVAMTDLGPAVGELMGDRALGAVARLLSFAVGATLIGLVLLDHEHCYAPVVEGAEGEEAADDGHGHGH
jgi:zinc transporter ZupT